MFNDQYGLTQAVLELLKDMTRRIIPEMRGRVYKKKPDIVWDANDECFLVFKDNDDIEPILLYPKYKIGEVLAVAQKYEDFRWPAPQRSDFQEILHSAGWNNKMFVRAELMPHRIRITNIRVERLQDISDDDCLREGIILSEDNRIFGFKNGKHYDTFRIPREAFSALIDKVSGKGTWDENPYVYVYEFEFLN